MERKPKLNIKGSKINGLTSQLLISTGIPALDDLIGGGLPVGGVVLVDEDLHGSYAQVILRYFLAEGVVNNHSCYVASLDIKPKEDLIHNLPQVNTQDVDHNVSQPTEKMKIAFRYENLPTNEKPLSKITFGNYYDLSKPLTPETIQSADINYYNGRIDSREDVVIDNPYYNQLLLEIKDQITDERFILNDKLDIKKILRIGIHRIGSPLWDSKEDFKDLRMFLFYLKCLMRKSFGVVMLTVPTHLSKKLKEIYDSRLVYIGDIALGLEAFAGTKYERNKILSDYHGFFHIVKLAAINTLVSKHPGSVEYTFKLKKKKLVIEKLHLPPDFDDDDGKKKNEVPMMGCGGGSSHSNLDF